jgi:peptidoglycan/LPS O-acetylase OafA/YrhL
MRIARLDGIRGIAIIMVVLHHSGLLNAGWTGVDLFFVLSGFLITQILLKTKSDEDYWSTFYKKRARRILPPLIPLIILGLALTPGLNLWFGAAYLLFFGNAVMAAGYIVPILGITWSLAVEEHFYLVWPLAIRYLSRKNVAALACAIILIEPFLRAFATHYLSRQAVQVLTPFRLDGLAAGSILALSLEHARVVSLIKAVAAWGCAAAFGIYALLYRLLGHSFTHMENHALFNGLGYSLIVFIAFFFISYVLFHEDAVLSKVLSFRPLAELGKISYGVYLYHMLSMVLVAKFLGLGTLSTRSIRRIAIIDIPLAVIIAYLSYRFYEKPIMTWKGAGSSAKAATPFLAEEKIAE